MTETQLTPVWVVIPAAGIGQRMQSELPKQYLKIHGKTLIQHTLDCFIHHKDIAGIVVVLSSEDGYWNSLDSIKDLKNNSIISIEIPNEKNLKRSDSVLQGLKYLKGEENLAKDSWVMVHDAARPCVSKSDIDALLALRTIDSVGGILASPVRDTMKRTQSNSTADKTNHTVSHTESRDHLWHAMTPQMFKLGELSKAISESHKKNITITDECSAMENMGEAPQLIVGSPNNIKVTYPSDIELASLLIETKKEAQK